MESRPIYLITTMTELSESDLFYADLGCIRSVGFFYDFETARNAVCSNACDIWETCYDYAAIEKVNPGMYSDDIEERWFFKYNESTGEYEEIKEPEFMKHVGSLSIG